MVIDLYDAGLTKLSTGACLEKYKAKIRKGDLTKSGIRGSLRRVRGLDSDSKSEGGVDEDQMPDVEEDEDTF